VHCIPHGIDTEVFCPDPHQEQRAGPSRRVLFVGSHRRDIETLAEVLRRLEAVAPDIGCVLVTSPQVAETLGGRTNVDVRHGVSEDELIRLYREAAVVLQPMEESTANNSILESLACGTPVIATDIGGARDYLDEGCAVLTPPGDAEAIVDAVLDMTGDSAKCGRMGEAARKKALEFSWPVVAARLTGLYRSIA
jgi:glycosyltransferase involved in cell wall biosynthesis